MCLGELLEEGAEDGELGFEGGGVGGAEGGTVGGELGRGYAGAVEGGEADAFAGHGGKEGLGGQEMVFGGEVWEEMWWRLEGMTTLVMEGGEDGGVGGCRMGKYVKGI